MPDVLQLLSSLSWVVHPLGGITLAFIASILFSSARRRRWPPLLGAVLLLLALSVLGADWLVHPAAGLTLALLASLVFRRWRRERVTVVAALLALLIFAVLGASWVVFPLLALGLAWYAKVTVTGELSRARPVGVSRVAPVALPAEGSGERLDFSGWGAQVGQQLGERVQRRLAKRVMRLERRAGRLGVPLNLRKPEPPASAQAAGPAPASSPSAEGLLALARDVRLPADSRARLGALHVRCRESLTYLGERGQEAAGASFLVEQIMADYAPEAVTAYLKLPPSLADVAALQDGKTGRDLLNEQLDLLLGAVRGVMDDAAQAGGQHLLAHRRFLQEKFGQKGGELKL